jgi:epoxyqueuosine reductase
MQEVPSTVDTAALLTRLRGWARELGFSQIAVADVDLSSAEPGLQAWLDAGHHGRMHYMASHGLKRARPAELVPGTLRVITARMDYLPRGTGLGWQAVEWAGLATPGQAQVSMYARGRDYHKVLRQRLQKLAERLQDEVGPRGHRVFTDSAPVLEVELAARSGLGWRGKHTLTLHREAGSMFFLGEIFVDLDLPLTDAVSAHCGECRACIDVCPTAAITAPYRVDARRCISYLTIEHDGAIPLELRPLMGNRVYGCDDCQLACPWNKFAQPAVLADFDVRPGMAGAPIATLLDWDEAEFLRRTEGSAIRRIGFARWRRNLAVAAGNALRLHDDAGLRAALQRARQGADALVTEHIEWALSAPAAPAALSSATLTNGAPA